MGKGTVVAGDVFESNQLSEQTLLRAVNAFADLPVPVFLLPGNHDPLDAASIFDSAQLSACANVEVLTDSQPRRVSGVDGVEIVGAPWRSKAPTTNPLRPVLAELNALSGGHRIVVAHGQTDALAPDPNKPDLIAMAEVDTALAEGRLHYLALGDRHSTLSVGRSGRVWFSGAPVTTAFVEDAPNQVLLVTLDDADHGGGVEVAPLAVSDWRFLQLQWVLNSTDDLAAALADVDALPNKERTAIKVGVSGTLDLPSYADLEDAFASRAELFASFRLRQSASDLAVLPGALEELDLGLGGYALAAWDELRTRAQSEPEAAAALRLFYRLVSREEGRVGS